MFKILKGGLQRWKKSICIIYFKNDDVSTVRIVNFIFQLKLLGLACLFFEKLEMLERQDILKVKI